MRISRIAPWTVLLCSGLLTLAFWVNPPAVPRFLSGAIRPGAPAEDHPAAGQLMLQEFSFAMPAAAIQRQPDSQSASGQFASWFEQLRHLPPGPQQEQEMQQLLKRWAEHDPQSALKAAADFTSVEREKMIGAVISGWVAKDPEATLAWIFASASNHRFLLPVMKDWAAIDPINAFSLAKNLTVSDDALRRQLYSTIIQAVVAMGNYEQARQLAMAVDDSAQREQLVVELVTIWARDKPQNVAAWVMEMPEGAAREQAAGNLTYEWARADPEAAADFAAAMPFGPSRKQALANSIVAWANDDVDAASAWLNRFDPHPDIDAAIAVIATSSKVVRQNPEMAMSWADRIVSPAESREAFQQIVQQWWNRDPGGLEHYLQN